MSQPPPDIEQFTNEIKNELNSGYSFIPFLGSGVSAASGLMMGREFEDYLVYAIYRCIAPNQPLDRWNLDRDGWLRKPTSKQSETAVGWLKLRFSELTAELKDKDLPPFLPCFSRWDRDDTEYSTLQTLEQYGGEEAAWKAQVEAACRRWERPTGRAETRESTTEKLATTWSNFSLDERDSKEIGFVRAECVVLEKALRSLYDWKAILSFLSHLNEGKFEERFYPSKGGRESGLIFQEKSNRTIIDRFNLHITWGQKPNLAHNQIVHLSRPLRIRSILTTNFDSLMEQAFWQVKLPIRVIETTVDGFLPDPALAIGTNCLVKLHGGDQQTRADFTLNEAPSETDRRRFVQYLYHERDVGDRRNGHYNPSHLLLLGFSGSDWRIIDLIKEALWRIPGLKVFCVANSSRSQRTFEQQFKGWEESVRVFPLGRADLVLLRLYQELTLTLPPGGFSSRFGQPIPAGNHPTTQAKEDARAVIEFLKASRPRSRYSIVKPACKKRSDLNSWITNSHPSYRKSENGGWIMVAQGESGQMRFFRALYEEHRYQQTVWMELEDCANANDLLAEIIRVLALNKGKYQTSHVDIDRHPDCANTAALEKWVGKILDYLDLSANECVIFLYGRNGPGGCAQLLAEYWTSTDYKKLEALIGVLSEVGMQIYYLPFSVSRSQRNSEKEAGTKHDLGVIGRVEQIKLMGTPGVEALQYSKRYWNTGRYGQRIPDSIIHKIAAGQSEKGFRGDTDGDDRGAGTFGTMLDRIAARFLLRREDDRLKNPWSTVAKQCGSEDFARQKSDVPDSLWLRVQFLYACSLFRQSRHPSALISEGIFSCPCAFTDIAKDNDFVRSEVAKEWLELLRTEGLFRDKPGGYLWQYRDSRLGLQAILESLTNLNLGAIPNEGSRENGDRENNSPHLNFLGQRRARLHFWIADWYRDAFQSTRHILPIIESLYHRCSSIHFARWAKPNRMSLEREIEDVVLYRAHLIIANLIEISDLVEMSFSAVSFWKPGLEGASIFERSSIFGAMDSHSWESVFDSDQEVRQNWVLELLGISAEKAHCAKNVTHYVSKILKLVDQVAVKIDSVNGKLRMEVAGGFSAVIDPSRSTESEKLKKGVETIVVESDFYCRGGRAKISADLSGILEKCFPHDDEASEAGFPDWLSITESKAGAMGDSSVPPDRETREKSVAKWRKTMASVLTKAGSEPYAYVSLQALAELAYARIKSIKLTSRSSQISSHTRTLTKDGEELEWVNVTMICSLGLSLLRACDTASLTERIKLRQKFLAFYGLSLGILGRFYEAHRRLNQATGFCRYLPGSEGDLARVILRIRRAEVHLAEAHALRRRNDFQDKKVQARRVAAKIDDAVVSLEAAEHLLQGLSHRSLWWGRFYSLRLRAITLSGTLVTLAEKKKSESTDWILSLAFRRRHDYISSIRDIFSQAILLCHGDYYRLLRTIDYTLSAIAAVKLVLGRGVKDESLLTALKGENPRLYNEIRDAWLELKEEEKAQKGSEDQWCADFVTYLRKLEDHWKLKSFE